MHTKKMTTIFLLTFLWSSPGSASDTLVFSAVGDIVPIAFEENGEKKGLCYDLFLEVKKRLNLDMRIDFHPFKRMLKYLREGTIDGTIGIYYKADRKEYLIFSDNPIYWVRYSIFVEKGKEFDFAGIEDLYGKKVGIQSGWFVSSRFDEAVSEGKILVEETTENESNLRKLHEGRIDAFIGNYYISMHTLKRLSLQENIVALPNPVKKQKGVYWAISKKANNIADKSEFIDRVNKAIDNIRNDGTLDALKTKYTR